MAFYEEFSRHSISIAFMPYPEAYTRKIGYFCLAAGIGFASANLDIDEATVLYTTTAEYRQQFRDKFYTKLVAGGLFADVFQKTCHGFQSCRLVSVVASDRNIPDNNLSSRIFLTAESLFP